MESEAGEKTPSTETSGDGGSLKPPGEGGGEEPPSDGEEFKKFDDNNKEEMAEWLQNDHWQKWYAERSEAEQWALGVIQGGESYTLNKQLRDKDVLDERTKEIIKNLDSAIGSGSIPENITVYRGFTNKELSDRIKERPHGESTRIIFSDPGFSATSLSKEYCDSLTFENEKIIIKLNVPEGIHGVTMVRNDIGEYEVLFGRNSDILITGAEEKHGFLFVKGEMLK